MVQRLAHHGRAEAERRIGRPIDEALIGELVWVERSGTGEFCAKPTAEFERVLAALWQE